MTLRAACSPSKEVILEPVAVLIGMVFEGPVCREAFFFRHWDKSQVIGHIFQ